MADQDKIVVDEAGRPRYFQFERRLETVDAAAVAAGATGVAEPALTGATPQDSARSFLMANAETLGIPVEAVGDSLGLNAAEAPLPEGQALRFESEQSTMDTTTVTYVQTMFGLPIHEAGISVTTQGSDNAVAAASSTLHYDVEAAMPEEGLVPLTATGFDAATGAYDGKVRAAFGPNGRKLRINRTRLIVYRYDAAKRLDNHPYDKHDTGFGGEPPTLPVHEVPETVKDGTHYIVVEALFTLPLKSWGALNWRAFIDVESGAVLYLRALVDGATALVFDRDPITKTGNAANLPNATAAVLNLLRDNVTLTNLAAPVGGTQALRGTYVRRSISLTFRAPTILPRRTLIITATASSRW
jgi:hypothetical protein